MDYRKPLTDVLDEIVTAITFPVIIKSASVVGTTQELICCDILHAQAGFKITVTQGTYTIESIDADNEKIIVTDNTPSVPITAQTFQLYKPIFFHGTELETGDMLAHIKPFEEKIPMIWLRENFVEKILPRGNRMDRETELELFFLTNADYKKVIDDRMEEAIKPMMRLLQYFWEYMKSRTDLFELEDTDYTSETFTKFGVYAINKGIEKKLFADNLAGQKLKATVPMTKKINCKTC